MKSSAILTTFKNPLFLGSILVVILFIPGCELFNQEPASQEDPTMAGEFSSAVATSTLPVGDEVCPYGGIQVDSGIDENGNGKLDSDEVDQTEAVCNGAPGADGDQGTAGNAGTNGTDGLSALVLVSEEPVGDNCSFGGQKIEAGLDADRDGLLAAEEVDAKLTYFVCDAQPSFSDLVTQLNASDAQTFDRFGFSVAIHGDYAIVGAYFQDNGGTSNDNKGAAYVFHRDGTNTWDSGTKLVAYDAQNNDFFGFSVSLHGDYAIVGARFQDQGGTSADEKGAAYVFRRTGTNTWSRGVKLIAWDAQLDNLFGISVSISGDHALVGAYGWDNYRGAAYLFRRTTLNDWQPAIKFTSPDAQIGGHFGNITAIDGGTAIVGAYKENGGDGKSKIDSGAAYIFQ